MAFERKGKNSGGGAHPLPGVTANDYIIPSEKFEDAKGTAMEYARAAGSCFMILSDMHSERRAWARYFHIKGMDQRSRDMTDWLDGNLSKASKHGPAYAVPAQWPWQFDQSVSEDMCR